MLARLLMDMMAGPWRSMRSRRAQSLFEAGCRRVSAGDDEGARRKLEKSLSIAPRPDAWTALGDVRFRQRDYGKAEICYRAALEGEQSVRAHIRLGRALQGMGSMDEAIAEFRHARDLDPQAFATLRELILTLIQADNIRKATQLAEAASASHPRSYEAQILLGIVRQKAHDPLAAIACYEQALGARTDDPDLFDWRGSAYQELGRIQDAFTDYERALALQPDHVSARFHRALARLLLGDFERGWDDYELRRLNSACMARSPYPSWDGGSLRGRTLLVRREQGLGDEIMFASLLPELSGEAEHCIVECDVRLRSLLARTFPASTFFASLPDGSLPAPIAGRRIDFETQVGSIARHRRRSRESFPRHVGGYLRADPARIARWRSRLAEAGPGLKVGISWVGGVRKTRRGLRSLALEQWAPILSVPGARFVSLQYTGGAEHEAAAAGAALGIEIHHWPEAIEDYEETAALVCALDLVISVCTSVVHLCGALDRPVWVLAPYSPEWRYGLTGERMPWYSSARILRQRAFGEWGDVVEEVAVALRRRSAAT